MTEYSRRTTNSLGDTPRAAREGRHHVSEFLGTSLGVRLTDRLSRVVRDHGQDVGTQSEQPIALIRPSRAQALR